MFEGQSDVYWDGRAQNGTFYEGEWFYTVTAIPYYKARRKIIIECIAESIKEGMNVLDYGCGDGEYIRLLSNLVRDVSFTGIDISERMIERAKKNFSGKEYNFICSGTGVKDDKLYDVIYTSAIMAHISDDIMIGILDNLNQHLNEGGRYIMCEQSSVEYKSGAGWCRRPPPNIYFLFTTCRI